MATTWIKPIHKMKGRSVAATLADRICYADNPDKNNSHEYVKSYGCDYYTAANEFALSKEIYEQQTGRGGRNGDIIAYHVRQSFKPGEITPQAALEVGYSLMEKFTRGRHQFVVAVHTDKHHIHCHCIFSAVNLDCDRKFRNPIRSMKIVRQISDHLCAERGLSVIENPAKSKGKNYGKWQGDKKEPTGREKLCAIIDDNIIVGRTLTEYFTALKRAGVEIKSGKQFSFKPPGAKRFFRQDSLGEDYSEEAIRERLAGKRIVEPRKKVAAVVVSIPTIRVPKLLIDIEAKIQKAYSPGFEHYARIYNLKEMARTLIFMRDSGIGTYDELNAKIRTLDGEHDGKSTRIKEIETRQKEISELQRNIGTYNKTKDIFNE
ncbi:MAG: relaxase/mobilization nuclease domain-containing protein [Defluviitaleaceae bacterium]|nr:relaxase/mobilization nuclease domain-containing protein [Defluviitaleaceae bacterium]